MSAFEEKMLSKWMFQESQKVAGLWTGRDVIAGPPPGYTIDGKRSYRFSG
jgi:hypothetical protein